MLKNLRPEMRDIALDEIPDFGQGQQMALFADLDGRLSKHPEVGEYDQKI